ncbi:peptidase [Candidatus Nitrosotenuis uzonensis]|uniref:Secreted periplasmic Zn-dependent protease n=1 Tax=Candidatus Nitrosotenuis uzonensis TaxID=1407055 RepID=A0A812EZ03_9ARCH|nr:peptidase [Candidatus Nitrosotenuis uzonensis]CAE6487443.1 conserved exported hypothetical protein [Candidatus Nitrosotenuis uzonensis]
MRYVLLYLLLLVSAFSFPTAFAQHHGGEQAPPISFGDKKVTVSAILNPPDFIPGKNTMANLQIRFFDSNTNTNIEHVTYRVQIFRGESLLANQMFFDKDGELNIRVQPVGGCQEKDLWRCTTYEGEKDLVVPNALTSSGNSLPIIKGPVFDKSGTYTLKVAIIGATNPKTQTAQDINFETSINIAQEQQFSFATGGGNTPVTVKAFGDSLTGLKFDETTKAITFTMPFHWEHAEHVQLVRNDIEIPKSFSPYSSVHSFKGTINGIPIFPSGLHYDIYSKKDVNVLHFAVGSEELKMMSKKLGSSDKHTMTVVIMPDENAIISSDVAFSNGYKAKISYDSRYGANKDVAFTLAFFDSGGEIAKDIRYAFSVMDSSGDEFIQNIGNNPQLLGITVPSGVDSRLITIPEQGKYTLQLVLVGRGLVDFNPFSSATMKFEIGNMVQPPTQIQIPVWIKNNAKWWADGTIGDADFVSGIQFLIKQGVIKIPPTTPAGASTNQIPVWIKNNAKWWADGTIGDADFVSGIQFLVSQGIIRV